SSTRVTRSWSWPRCERGPSATACSWSTHPLRSGRSRMGRSCECGSTSTAPRRSKPPGSSGSWRRSFRLGSLLARPGPGQLRERPPRAVVEDAPCGPEDRALERQRREELRPRRLTALRVRRLLLVDQAPDLLEELLAD